MLPVNTLNEGRAETRKKRRNNELGRSTSENKNTLGSLNIFTRAAREKMILGFSLSFRV